MTVLPPYLLFSGLMAEAPGCLLQGELTEKGKHSWEPGEGDPSVALKETQRGGSLVAAGQ